MSFALEDAGYWNSPEQCDAANEIVTLRAQIEKLTKERDIKEHCITQFELEDLRMKEQLAALAEQNEKMKADRSSVWMVATKVCMMLFATKEDADQSQSQQGASTYTVPVAVPVFGAQLPDLASPVLNRIRAEGMEMAAKWFNDHVDNRTDTWQAQELRRMAAELRKQNG